MCQFCRLYGRFAEYVWHIWGTRIPAGRRRDAEPLILEDVGTRHPPQKPRYERLD